MRTTSLTEAKTALPFQSLVEMRAVFNKLARDYSETLETDPSSDLLNQAGKFLTRGRETGMVLDNPDERWEAQNMLNFWAKILFRYRRAREDEPLSARLADFGSFQSKDEDGHPVAFQAPPKPLDVYVGRESFLSDLKQRLLAGRDVVLCSSPGTGKTILAVKLVHQPELRKQYSDGVLWASLGDQPDVSAILRKWMGALDIPMNEDDWLDQEHAGNLIRQALGRRRMLLVIDDAWQSDVALALKLGGENCAHIVTTYLMPVALDFDPGAVVTVPGLSRSDGVRLLGNEAPQAVAGQEHDAEELVDAVDNSPLALALLGNYYRFHSPEGRHPSLTRLQRRLIKEKQAIEAERPPAAITDACNKVQTHASVLAAISWCFAHLDSDEKYVLQAFSAFPPKPNTFSDAAAGVITEGRAKGIELLLDCELLQKSSEGRYSLHRAVSDFLKRRAQALTDHATEQRMVQFYVDLAKTHAASHDVLAQEQKNILAALEVAHKQGLWDLVVEGTNALFGYYDRQGLYVLAKNTLAQAREAAERSGNERSLAAILLKLGEINERRSEYVDANKHLQLSLEIAKRVGDEDVCARALQGLGVVAMAVAQYADAERHLNEALKLAKNTEIECAIETKLGWMERGLGKFKESRTRTERALKLALDLESFWQVAELKLSLGVLDYFEGNYKEAKKHDKEGLRYAKKARDKRLQCGLYQALGGVEIELENLEEAEAHLMKSLHLAIEIGHRWYNGVIWKEIGELKIKQKLPNAAASAFKKAVELAREVNSPELTGLALYGLARVAALQKNYVEARLQGRTSLDIFQSIGHHKKGDVMAWLSSMNANGHSSN